MKEVEEHENGRFKALKPGNTFYACIKAEEFSRKDIEKGDYLIPTETTLEKEKCTIESFRGYYRVFKNSEPLFTETEV